MRVLVIARSVAGREEGSLMRRWTYAACVTVTLIIMSVESSYAQGTGNDRCVTLINNDARKVLDARAKADRKCAQRNPGSNVTTCIDGIDAKTEKRKAKLTEHYSDRCSASPPAFGLASGSTAAAAAGDAANDIAHDLFGGSIVVGTGEQLRCQEKVLQRVGQLAVTRWKEFRDCKKTNLANVSNATELAAVCLGGPNGPQPDPHGRISARETRIDADIQRRCVGKGIDPVAGVFAGLCAGVSNQEFAACVGARASCNFCLAVKNADQLPNGSINCDLFDDGVLGNCGPQPSPTPTLTPTIATPTPTATPTGTPTPTATVAAPPTVPDICQTQIGLPAIAQVPFTVLPGSTFCGGTALNPPADPPLSGNVADASSASLGDLGVGCLYAGSFDGIRLPSGGTAVLDVVGLQLLPPVVTLGGSEGSGPFDCTKGAGPDRHCTNGAAGTDGSGACASDANCGGVPGTCNLDANCFFGPPIPILAGGTIGACVVNAFLTDLCGQVTLLPPGANLAAALSARVYLTLDAESPCPQCVEGACTAGKNAGQPCTPLGSENTSIDCPPNDASFVTTLTVPIASLSTGTSTLSAPDGFFCPEQTVPGAFGLPDARTVSEMGTPPGGGGSLLSMTLAAAFCVPESGNELIDGLANLPGPGAVSAAGELDLSGVLPLP
jgi:hypothetical protein